MSDAAARWTALLDAIDEGLLVSPPVLLDALPSDIIPVPPALAARAAATLRRMAEAAAALERQRSVLAGELAALSAARSATAATGGAPVPFFLDTKA
jgi:hypothetical protein